MIVWIIRGFGGYDIDNSRSDNKTVVIKPNSGATLLNICTSLDLIFVQSMGSNYQEKLLSNKLQNAFICNCA